MIREHLFDKRAPADSMFRWRGGDVSRRSAVKDGVFVQYHSSVESTAREYEAQIADIRSRAKIDAVENL